MTENTVHLPEINIVIKKRKTQYPEENISAHKKIPRSNPQLPSRPDGKTNDAPLKPPINQPFLVNPKQYKRILKRREQRKQLEEKGIIPKERKKYLHELEEMRY